MPYYVKFVLLQPPFSSNGLVGAKSLIKTRAGRPITLFIFEFRYLLTRWFFLVDHGGLRSGLNNLVPVLGDHIVKDGVVVAELLESHAEGEVFLLIELVNGVLEVSDARILDSLGDVLSAEDEVLGNGLEGAKSGFLGALELSQSFFLDSNAKVVSVLNTRDVQLNPDLYGGQVLDKLKQASFQQFGGIKQHRVAQSLRIAQNTVAARRRRCNLTFNSSSASFGSLALLLVGSRLIAILLTVGGGYSQKGDANIVGGYVQLGGLEISVSIGLLFECYVYFKRMEGVLS